ncbi:HlyD family secretion protein [Sphingosinicella sp. CPCC 101087]|uniref:HlyD family secretion protein n=1 Tax=Sphingosinicella sp. CPCC 101087 TaxID=2497754 RepID=UPI00101BB637|nr:HlyD family secretion protein [Sphingosinicella sp. CPCC 101087]
MARIRGLRHLGALLCLAAVVVSLFAWSWARSDAATTDNAYVRGDITSLAPKVGGYVTSVEVQDNQPVRVGEVLFRIDRRDYQARLAQAEANVAAASARLANTEQEIRLQISLIQQAEAQRSAALADMDLARVTNARRRALIDAGFVTRAQVDESDAGRLRAEAAAAASSATVRAQRQRIDVLSAQREAAAAAVAQAEAARELAQIDLENTVVRAPIAGVVGNRQVRVGRLVAPGASLLDIVPIADLFVVANFKETQLQHIRRGQTARVRIDSYPDVTFEGVIDSFAPGSGSAFSLIPTDNATGNFVRVVQRVPVKIRLRRNPLLGRLVPGMSAQVEIERSRAS